MVYRLNNCLITDCTAQVINAVLFPIIIVLSKLYRVYFLSSYQYDYLYLHCFSSLKEGRCCIVTISITRGLTSTLSDRQTKLNTAVSTRRL